MLVDLQSPPDNAAIIVKIAMPEWIAQHHIGRAVVAMLVRGVVKAAEEGCTSSASK